LGIQSQAAQGFHQEKTAARVIVRDQGADGIGATPVA